LKTQGLRDKQVSDAETKYESINDSVENNFVNSSAKQKIYSADSDKQAETTETRENMKSKNTEA